MADNTRVSDPPITFRTPHDVLSKLLELKNNWGVNRTQAIIRCIQYAWNHEIGYRKAGFIKPDSQSENVKLSLVNNERDND